MQAAVDLLVGPRTAEPGIRGEDVDRSQLVLDPRLELRGRLVVAQVGRESGGAPAKKS
ncbi:MAG: hypothetical protein ACRDM0_20485 [Thermoleophilaceae bacterium]